MSVNNRKVLMSRAPMTTPSVMKVRVIKEGDAWAALIEADTCYISPLANVRDAGDCDGDNRVFCDAEDSDLELTSLDDVVNNVIERTGSDQLVPGGAYWGDHYNVPSEKAIAKKRGLGVKNLSLDNGSYRKSLVGMLEGSTQTFQEAVGWVHLLFLASDLYLSLVWTLQGDLKQLFPDWKPLSFTENKSLVLILAEIYEVPLGGLSWEAYDVIFDVLIPIIKGGLSLDKPEQLVEVEGLLTAADMNGSAAADIVAAAFLVAQCRDIAKTGEADGLMEDPNVFLMLVTQIAVLISKGQLDLVSSHQHRALIELYESWVKAYDSGNTLIGKSATLMQVQEFVETVATAICGDVPEIDLSFFDF